jgi:hypothetical protein
MRFWSLHRVPDLCFVCHAAIVGGAMYVFGGILIGRSNDLWKFDFLDMKWTLVTEFTGAAPSPRSGHSANALGQSMLVFGGEGPPDGTRKPMKPIQGHGQNRVHIRSHRVDFGDMFMLDTDRMAWTAMKVTGGYTAEGHHAPKPTSRRAHTVTHVPPKKDDVEGLGELWLYGGAGPDITLGMETTFSDLYVLNTTTMVWTQVIPTGCKLPKRAGHTATFLHGKLFFVGGVCEGKSPMLDDGTIVNISPFNEVYVVDVETHVCNKLVTSGVTMPETLYGHSACWYPRNIPNAGNSFGRGIYIFGGRNKRGHVVDDNHTYCLDSGTGNWTIVKIDGFKPAPRCDHLMSTVAGNTAILYGGLDTRPGVGNATNTMYCLVFKKGRAEEPEPAAAAKKKLGPRIKSPQKLSRETKANLQTPRLKTFADHKASIRGFLNGDEPAVVMDGMKTWKLKVQMLRLKSAIIAYS